MKTLTTVLTIGLAGALTLGALPALADFEVSAGVQIHATADFHAPLAPQGVWVEVGSYGRCWHPAHVVVGWTPYCVGHWVWTDCGWYWASDEPWAWACYHYGWWTLDPVYGWIWVPGIEWAPAWVSWRVGGGYIGWAPFAPHGVIVAPAAFVFVEAHRFREPIRPTTVIVNNTTIINKTTQITALKRETRTFEGGKAQRVVVNEGPGVDVVQKATGQKVSAVPIREVARQTPVPASLTRQTPEPRSAEKQVAAPQPPKPTPAHPAVPGQAPTASPTPTHPKAGGPPPKHEAAPGPSHPPPSAIPPGKPQQKPKHGGEGREQGKDR